MCPVCSRREAFCPLEFPSPGGIVVSAVRGLGLCVLSRLFSLSVWQECSSVAFSLLSGNWDQVCLNAFVFPSHLIYGLMGDRNLAWKTFPFRTLKAPIYCLRSSSFQSCCPAVWETVANRVCLYVLCFFCMEVSGDCAPSFSSFTVLVLVSFHPSAGHFVDLVHLEIMFFGSGNFSWVTFFAPFLSAFCSLVG